MNRKMHNRLGKLFTNISYTKLDKINRAIDHPDMYDMAFTNIDHWMEIQIIIIMMFLI